MLIPELLPTLANRQPSAIAMKHRGDTITYGDLHLRVERLAAAFVRQGIRAGDRVMLFGHPSIALCVAECAAVAAHAIPVAAFPSYAPVEIQRLVDDAMPSAMVFDEENRAVAEQLRYPRRPIEISCDGRPGTYLTTDELLQQQLPPLAWRPPDPDAIALIIYTSGSTGRPKGVAHTHRSFSNWMGMCARSVGDHPSKKVILFNLAHGSGQSALWATLSAGGCLTILDRYPARAEEVADVIERDRITSLVLVAGTLRDLLSVPGVEKRAFGSVRSVVVGGAASSSHTLLRAASLLRSAWIGNAYSLTETGQVVSILPASHLIATNRLERLQSVGLPALTRLFGQEPCSVRVVDEERRPLPCGEIGELAVRGPQMMRGYWNNAEATRIAIRDGWFQTGDIGRMDAEGYLYLADRKKDMIIPGNAVNIYSVEVEDVVCAHPSVREAAALALRTDGESEEVAVVASMQDGHTLTLEELRRFCAGQLADFKTPRHLFLVPALPRTPADKIDKPALRRLCEARWADAVPVRSSAPAGPRQEVGARPAS